MAFETTIIKYLQELQTLDYRSLGRSTWVNEPKSITEILFLEQEYNEGKPFPAVLRELLFIAGNGCPLIELRPENLQQQIRLAVSASSHSIPENYLAFDFLDFSSFSLVYTSQNTEDPKVYHVELSPSEEQHTEFIEDSEFTLLKLLKHRISQVKQGYSPF